MVYINIYKYDDSAKHWSYIRFDIKSVLVKTMHRNRSVNSIIINL